ncbi:hypothetical protein [Aquicoccus sp. SU-CL01552]|uniref:hypothetical protein n=1 Tax=Aquicoccus sp. SU-CL01552 TaxID=3127656 RepID=UPI003102D800
MTSTNEIAHSVHLREGRDHDRWRQEHMEALAVLKRVEAAIFTHEARILAHDVEIARHEEQIAHGDANADAPQAEAHDRLLKAHEASSEHHKGLLDAIRALAVHLEGRG